MQLTRSSTHAAVALMIATALSVLWAGCGDTSAADPTPVQTFKITPAANATVPPVPSETVVTGEPTTEPSATTSGGATTVAIAGQSNEFDVEEISAPAGTITIEFENRDSGVVHNIHFYRGSDSDGESVAETELEVGPVEQSVTFDVEAGEYYYVCDAHPTTMEGTLTVE